MKTLPSFCLIILLTLAGCGGGGPPTASERTASPNSSPTEDGARTDDRDGSSEGERTEAGEGGSGGTRSDASEDGSDSPATPRPTVPPSAIAPPHAEWYHYAVSGSRKTPGMGAEEPYPEDARFVWTFSHFTTVGSGVEFVYRGDLAADGLKTEDRIMLRKAGLRRSYNSVTLLDGTTYACEYDPRIAYANAPLREETYPKQEWKGAGCSGTSEFTNEGRTKVKDATGKTWEVWRITERTTYRIQTAEGMVRAVHWFNNDVGADIKTHWVEEGTVAATRSYSYDRTFLLEKKKDPPEQTPAPD